MNEPGIAYELEASWWTILTAGIAEKTFAFLCGLSLLRLSAWLPVRICVALSMACVVYYEGDALGPVLYCVGCGIVCVVCEPTTHCPVHGWHRQNPCRQCAINREHGN